MCENVMKGRGFIGVLIFVFIFLLLVNVAHAESALDSVDKKVNSFDNWRASVEDKSTGYFVGIGMDYAKNSSFVRGFNSVLSKGDTFYYYIFGVRYSFSFIFFLSIIFWILFFMLFLTILLIVPYRALNVLSFPISFALVVMLAFFRFFSFFSTLYLSIIFYKNGYWPVIVFIISLIIIGVIVLLLGEIKKTAKKGKEIEEEEDTKRDKELIHKFAEGINKGLEE